LHVLASPTPVVAVSRSSARPRRGPVDLGPLGDVGVALQPPARERTPRHHGQSVVDRSRHGRTDQLAADTSSFEPLRDLGVQEEQPIRLGPVEELRPGAALFEDEALMRTVVADGRRGFGGAHDATGGDAGSGKPAANALQRATSPISSCVGFTHPVMVSSIRSSGTPTRSHAASVVRASRSSPRRCESPPP
jgi:hypothetical protein